MQYSKSLEINKNNHSIELLFKFNMDITPEEKDTGTAEQYSPVNVSAVLTNGSKPLNDCPQWVIDRFESWVDNTNMYLFTKQYS